MRVGRQRAVNAALLVGCALVLVGFVVLAGWAVAHVLMHFIDGVGDTNASGQTMG